MDWFTLGPAVLGILFAVALLAGFIDSIAGGGGLLTVPALLAVGLPQRRPWRPISCNLLAVRSPPACTLFVVVRLT